MQELAELTDLGLDEINVDGKEEDEGDAVKQSKLSPMNGIVCVQI